MDGIKYRVDQGMSFEQATAAVMNHEILHALRGMDLFTAQEYSLLERLTRQYSKPGTDMTYGQWAVSTYPELSAVAQQEEAIAEMISDSLTNNVLIDGKAQALSGKPAGIIQRIVDLFKRLVGFARDNDINSYQELVNANTDWTSWWQGAGPSTNLGADRERSRRNRRAKHHNRRVTA